MGLSSTITTETLARRGDAKAQAEYLKLFRQDHSVKDCEAIRRCLTADWEGPEERRKWSTLGQSYGGFVTLSYLSFAYVHVPATLCIGIIDARNPAKC